jgi:hypothetical protein
MGTAKGSRTGWYQFFGQCLLVTSRGPPGVTETALREILFLRSSPRAAVRVALIRTALGSSHHLHVELERSAAAS